MGCEMGKKICKYMQTRVHIIFVFSFSQILMEKKLPSKTNQQKTPTITVKDREKAIPYKITYPQLPLGIKAIIS